MTPDKPSLRTRVARHVLFPLAAVWLTGTVVTLAVAEHFAGLAFDRSLVDDAYALAANVHQAEGRLGVSLSEREIGTLLFDQSESMYFAVIDSEGRQVAGTPGLRAPAAAATAARADALGSDHAFHDISFEGKLLRAVNVHVSRPAAFNVVVAQTTVSRSRLLQSALLYAAVPQLVLLMLLALWLRRRIGSDLAPLVELQQAIAQRDANDLAPLPVQLAGNASTRDVERLSSALDSLLARLQRSLYAQREFAGTVAHELRNPLAGIRAQASFALRSSDPAVWREQLEAIAESEGRASRLVEQLLALARAGEGSEGLRLEALPLGEVVRDVLLRFMGRAESAGVDLGGEGLDEPATVVADRALVEGILGNLLDNALRYATAPAPQVTVAIGSDAHGVTLFVTDNGPGLADLEAASARRRWTQGDAGVVLGEGAGLGLAIVGRYAELLGATFTLERATADGGLRAAIRFAGANPA